MVVLNSSLKLSPPSPSNPATLPPSQVCLWCPIQRPSNHPTGNLLLIVTYSHVNLSDRLSGLPAAPTTCQPASHVSSQPSQWGPHLFPLFTCFASCFTGDCHDHTHSSPVDSPSASLRSYLASGGSLQLFSQLACLSVMLSSILSLSFQPTTCLFR